MSVHIWACSKYIDNNGSDKSKDNTSNNGNGTDKVYDKIYW